ncbi:MAG: hypothetical protein KOO61_00780 [Spirochaetales bacterium]|nr:hypothetical protein [Spirochaetales bacterium]
MNRRHRHLLILCISIIAFAGMVTLVSLGVISRRRNRDLTFGLERVDVLIAEGRLAEATAMVPWLADRADEASEMLSVLKRGVTVLDAGAGPEALDEAAQRAVGTFPGNATFRSLAVYAAVMTSDMDRALEWSRAYLIDDDPEMFAWVLLKSDAEVPERSESSADDTLYESFFLAGLDNQARAEDFERAWRLTGDWRYASNAAILFLQDGAVAPALDLVVGASLPLRAPVLAADVLQDAGDAQGALNALRNAGTNDESRALPRTADALMSIGRYDEAERVYLDLIRRMPGLSDVPLLNLAWLGTSPQESAGYYDAAVAGFPESWRAVEQRALHLALSDLETAYASLGEYTGPHAGSRESLLRLKLEPFMDPRGYEAAVWTLVAEPDSPEDALRFAAWYFDGRGQHDALLEFLERVDLRSAWAETYTGISLARAGQWSDAVDSFRAAYSAGPSWMTALNLALCHFAAGNPREGTEALDNAVQYARQSGLPPESASVFVTISRITTDRLAAYEAITTALELDPTNTQALFIRDRLESGSGYQ